MPPLGTDLNRYAQLRGAPDAPAKLDGLQVLRALAATGVVFFHVVGGSSWAKVLDCGINVFFVLSGFLMAYLYRPGQRWTSFVRKRLLRMIPLYYFTVAATLAYGFYVGRTYSAWDLTMAASLWPTQDPMVTVSWTLSHELLFYGMFSLVYLHRKLGITTLALWLLAIALAYPAGWKTFVTSHYNFLFFVGIGLATAVRHARRAAPMLAIVMMIGGLCTLFTVNYRHLFVAPQDPTIRTLGNAVGASLLLLGSYWLEPRVRYPRWLTWLGDASYSIYLLHPFGFGVGYKLLSMFPRPGECARHGACRHRPDGSARVLRAGRAADVAQDAQGATTRPAARLGRDQGRDVGEHQVERQLDEHPLGPLHGPHHHHAAEQRDAADHERERDRVRLAQPGRDQPADERLAEVRSHDHEERRRRQRVDVGLEALLVLEVEALGCWVEHLGVEQDQRHVDRHAGGEPYHDREGVPEHVGQRVALPARRLTYARRSRDIRAHRRG